MTTSTPPSNLPNLIRRVINGDITASEVVAEVRSMAPPSARSDRQHPWWQVEGEESLDTIMKVASGDVYLSGKAAAREARRVRGKVVSETVCRVSFYRVIPFDRADEEVVEKIVGAAFPAEMVEPRWGDDLPGLDEFRRLSELQYLTRLIEQAGWNISAAARDAGVTRQTMQRLLAVHGLERPGDRTSRPNPKRQPRAGLQLVAQVA